MELARVAQIKELREAVSSASEHTKRQLDSVDSSPVKSLVSIFISLGISYFLRISLLWIPVSLLILPLWSFYGLLITINRVRTKQIKQVQETQEKLGDKVFDYGFIWIFRNTSSMVKGLSAIFIVSFFIFVGILAGIVPFNQELPKVVPLITLAIYSVTPLFFDNLSDYLEKGGIVNYLKRVPSLSNKKQLLLLLAIIVLVLVSAMAMYVLPIWSLIQTRPFYYPFTTESWLILLVAFLQFITFAMFCNYFSSLSARKELSNTLTNLASIDYQINRLILNNDVSEESLSELKTSFMAAKRYELGIDNFFLIFPFYALTMSKVQIKENLNKNPKSEQKTAA